MEASNSYPINRPLSSNAILTCDASSVGYGAHITVCGNEQKFCSGMWKETERVKSSTFREFKAVLLALQSFCSFLAGGKVKVFSDNQNVARVAHYGSSVVELQQIAVNIFSFCMRHSISFQMQWIPRGENELADYLSRIVDPDDGMLSPSLFQLITDRSGPFQVDRMACDYNCQLTRFNSKFWCPGTEAVDCFSQDWGGRM